MATQTRQHPPVPTASLSDTDKALLNAFVTLKTSVYDLAPLCGLTPVDLLVWTRQPHIQTVLAELKSLADNHLLLRATQTQVAALDTLEQVARRGETPVERRRAASSILHVFSPAAAACPPPAGKPSDRPPRTAQAHPRHLPARHLQPAHAVAAVLTALATNDHPAPDCGLATLHAFLTDDARAGTPHLDDLRARTVHDSALAALLNHHRAHLGQPIVAGRQAAIPVTITPALSDDALGAEPRQPLAYTFHLIKPDSGPRRFCWLINRIQSEPP